MELHFRIAGDSDFVIGRVRIDGGGKGAGAVINEHLCDGVVKYELDFPLTVIEPGFRNLAVPVPGEILIKIIGAAFCAVNIGPIFVIHPKDKALSLVIGEK